MTRFARQVIAANKLCRQAFELGREAADNGLSLDANPWLRSNNRLLRDAWANGFENDSPVLTQTSFNFGE